MIDEKDLQQLIKIKQKREGKFSKKIVAFVIALNVFFTAAVLFIFYFSGNEPTSLIYSWFGFTTVELWSLAGIKKREIKKDEEIAIQSNNEDMRGE